MNKKILHLQIPIHEIKRDDVILLINREMIQMFGEHLQERLGKDWTIITSPMIPSISDGEKTFINLDMSQFSKEEILELIEKSKVNET